MRKPSYLFSNKSEVEGPLLLEIGQTGMAWHMLHSFFDMIANWMTPNPITVSPERDLHHSLVIMMEARIRRLPVEDRGRLVGIITEKDIKERCVGNLTRLRLADMEDLLLYVKVGGVMTLQPVVVSPDTSLLEAAKTMAAKKIGGLPVVVEKGKLVGMITRGDVLRGLVSLMEREDCSKQASCQG